MSETVPAYGESLDLDAIEAEYGAIKIEPDAAAWASQYGLALIAEVRRLRALLEAFGGEEEISKRIAIMQEIRDDPFAVLMAGAVITQAEALRRYLAP